MLPVTPHRDLSGKARTLPRIGYGLTYVAAATILTADLYRPSCPPEEQPTVEPHGQVATCLREEASCDGLCYLRVIRQLACGDLYQAEVAASVDLLQRHPLSVFLAQEALYNVLPYDCRIVKLQPERILTLLHAHAESVRPLVKIDPLDATDTAQIDPFEPAEPVPHLEQTSTPPQANGHKKATRRLKKEAPTTGGV